MAFVHGKDAFISVNGDDLSSYTNNVEFNYTADSHDVTTFGQDAHIYQAGLTDGTVTLQGTFDNSNTDSPKAVLVTLVGSAAVSMTYRPQGTGSGLTQRTANVIVQNYQETVPVADMITWSVDLQLASTVSNINQS